MKLLTAILSLMLVAFASPAVARAAVINDLAGPSDYGATIQPVRYDLAGLTVGDTRQGQVQFCYGDAVTASIVHQWGALALAKNYAVQPDGTVNVTYFRNDQPTTIHVTSAINPWWGDPGTAYDDSNGDAAAAIMRKAYADFRTSQNTMASLGWGNPAEYLYALGFAPTITARTVAAIAQAEAQGFIGEVSTGAVVPAGAVADHTYSVWSVDLAAGTVTLRSPWGDGYESAGYQEYITVGNDFLSNSATEVVICGPGGESPLAVPEPASAALLGLGCVGLLRRKRRLQPSPPPPSKKLEGA